MSGISQGWAVNMIRLQQRRTITREKRVPVSSYPIPSCLCPCYVPSHVCLYCVSCPITRVSAVYPVLSHVCLCYVPCPITPLPILCTGGFKWKKSKSVWNREATSSCCKQTPEDQGCSWLRCPELGAQRPPALLCRAVCWPPANGSCLRLNHRLLRSFQIHHHTFISRKNTDILPNGKQKKSTVGLRLFA